MGTGPLARLYARTRRPFTSLRFRVPATAMIVFAVSLAVASVLAFQLFQQDGRRDIDIVIEREQQRFERSMTALLDEAQADDPNGDPQAQLEAAVRRYLELNPSTDSYWTIVTFQDGRRLAASNGPPELEPLFAERRLPAGEPNVRRTIDAGPEAGEIRTSSVPILLGDEQVGTLQIVSPLAPVRSDSLEATSFVVAAAAFTLVLGGILLAASLWRSLTPLGELAQTARSTELRSLDHRVAVPDVDDEVGQLAREFNTMLERLDRSSAQQREFMASVGHELRTPITIARGHLELLEGIAREDPDAVEETVAILQDELQRMGRLVEDLMAIARAEMDDFARPRALDLVSWFEELEFKLAGTAAGRTIRIVPPPPVAIVADPDRLAQAVLNLVNNAYVHTPEGTPIRIRAERGSGHVDVIVEDDGPGIPESIRDEMFSPFVRAGDAPTSTGLGLSVVRAVMDAHEGHVRVATSEHGTRVTLQLPWTPDPDDPPIDPSVPGTDEVVPSPRGTRDTDRMPRLPRTDDARVTAPVPRSS